VESLHLTGPPPTLRRLVQLAAELGLPHEVESAVLRVPIDAAPLLFDRSAKVLSPLEAGLVRVIRTDLTPLTPLAVLANAGAAPTLAHLVGRRRHRKLLEEINARHGVTVGFQPVAELDTEQTIGFEALLRVRVGMHDVSPADVLAAAEEAGRLVEVDGVARSVAVNEAAATLGDRLLFLNVLPSSLPMPAEQLAPFTTEVVELGLDPKHVVLEAPVGPGGMLRHQLEAVFGAAREAGFLVGLDNVRSERDLDAIMFRPDVVKLDRSLLRGLGSSSGRRSLGNVLRETMHASSMLVAQGIESVEHLRAVSDLGVRYGQGWHLGRPGKITPEVAADAS
jgi:EAL domain-containing protein (putative c-di-GMP-specific phosphodiesterase class I)